MDGITIEGTVERVTDGDTIRVTAEGRLFKVRVLGLDTEESNANPHKPVTKWGKEATAFATRILPVGAPVTIEFPGTEPVIVEDEVNTRYLDNYERPLGYVHLAEPLPDDTGHPVAGLTDLTEIMIRAGFSPYFVKYGRAEFPGHDARYDAAERAAQTDDLGVWNQLEANGAMTPEAEPRNYPRLTVWWELRARLIDVYREARAADPEAALYDTRIDYETLVERARERATVTVFMELKEGTTVGGTHHVYRSGSLAQPFQLFLRDEERPEIEAVKRLVSNRYAAEGEDRPRRNYAYVTGPLKLFRDRPEMEVEGVDQISDVPPGPTPRS